MIKYFMAALIFILIIISSLTFVILIFSSKRLSPIPYFPSNKKDLPLILESLNIRNDQIIFDLGAGDGIIIFEAAKEAFKKKLNTKFVAVEINPVLLFILHMRRFSHPNKKNIKIIKDDIFKMSFEYLSFPRLLAQARKQATVPSGKSRLVWIPHQVRNDNRTIKQFNNLTFYLYISPWYLEKTLTNIKKQLRKFSVVSYMYPIKSLKSKQKITEGKNSIYIY